MKLKYMRKYCVGGLGAQMGSISTLIPFAEKFGMKVVSDLRTFPYFRARRWLDVHNYPIDQEPSSFLNDDKVDQLLEFHPCLAHNSEVIDSIDNAEIFSLDKLGTQRQVLDWLLSGKARREWKYIMNHPQRTQSSSSPPPQRSRQYWFPFHFTQLPIRIKDRALIKKYEARIRNSVAIHARFGNGEVERFTDYWPEKELPKTLRRLQINPDKFIKEMKKYDEDFFVCTDTFSFMEKCKNAFGDRVFCTDRSWAPEGIGPGHNPNQFVSNPLNSVPVHLPRRLREPGEPVEGINQWDNFYEALAEMELLSKGKHLICNSSAFSAFARDNCSHTELSHDHKPQI